MDTGCFNAELLYLMMNGAQVLCLFHRSFFDFNKKVKAAAGCSRY